MVVCPVFVCEGGRVAHEMAPGVRGLMWVQHIGDFGVMTNPHVIGSRSWEDVEFVQHPIEVPPNHQLRAKVGVNASISPKSALEGLHEHVSICCLTSARDVKVDQHIWRIKHGHRQTQQTTLACISICLGTLLPPTCIARPYILYNVRVAPCIRIDPNHQEMCD